MAAALARHWGAFLIFGVAALTPILVRDAYFLDSLVLILLWGALSAAWNVAGGYAGQVSIGHASFFAIGGYAFAWAAKVSPGLHPLLLLAAAGLLGGGILWQSLVGRPEAEQLHALQHLLIAGLLNDLTIQPGLLGVRHDRPSPQLCFFRDFAGTSLLIVPYAR